MVLVARAQYQAEQKRAAARGMTSRDVERTQLTSYVTIVHDTVVNNVSVVAHEPSEYLNKGQVHHNRLLKRLQSRRAWQRC